MKKLFALLILVCSGVALTIADNFSIKDNLIIGKTGKEEGQKKENRVAQLSVARLNRPGDMTSARERYYEAVSTYYGWWVGHGKEIPRRELASHDGYYRLSNKNSNGHWQTVEYISSDNSLPPDRIFFASFLNLDDEEAVSCEIMKLAVRWEFLTDPTGTLMLEERGYDRDGALLYKFHRTEYSEGMMVGAYIGPEGIPAFNDRLIHIQADKSGRDFVVNFTDDEGYFRPDRRGVYEIHLNYQSAIPFTEDYNVAGRPLSTPLNETK